MGLSHFHFRSLQLCGALLRSQRQRSQSLVTIKHCQTKASTGFPIPPHGILLSGHPMSRPVPNRSTQTWAGADTTRRRKRSYKKRAPKAERNAPGQIKRRERDSTLNMQPEQENPQGWDPRYEEVFSLTMLYWFLRTTFWVSKSRPLRKMHCIWLR